MKNLYNLDKLTRIHIEITANCNSACPQCERYIKQDYTPDIMQPNFRHLKQGDMSPVIKDVQGSKGHMPFETFKNCVNVESAVKLNCVEFNGTWGDAIMHPELDRFVDHIIATKEIILRTCNKDNYMGCKIATNGAIRSPEWWANMAKKFIKLDEMSLESCGRPARDNRVVFAIDGMDNVTHQMYRRGCELDRVLENAQAFIDAGGKAEWQWIEFNHNEHQLDDAVELARKMGFSHIYTRGSRRLKEHFLREEVHKPGKVKEVDKNFGSVVNKETETGKKLDKKLKVNEIKNPKLNIHKH